MGWRARTAGVIALAATATGCGVYSVRMDPAPTIRPVPLDLSVSLGDVRTVVDGRAVEVDRETLAAIDADFVAAARASGRFRQVLSRGSATDLVVDLDRTQNVPPLGTARAAYLVLAGPLVAAPGVPYPWDYRIGRRVVVRGVLDGTSYELAERSGSWDQRVWGSTYWGGRGVDPLREQEGEYVVGLTNLALAARQDLFDGFANAVRTGDVESAYLLSVQAKARRDAATPVVSGTAGPSGSGTARAER
jgi:hypothetical protein